MCRGCHDPPCSRWRGGAGLLPPPEGPSGMRPRSVGRGCCWASCCCCWGRGGGQLRCCQSLSRGLWKGGLQRGCLPPQGCAFCPRSVPGQGHTSALVLHGPQPLLLSVHGQRRPLFLNVLWGTSLAPPKLQGRGAELGDVPPPAASVSSSLLQEHSLLLSPHCL